MSIYAAPVEVVNAALSRMGVRPIVDFSDPAKPAVVANDIYEGVVRDALAKHAWSFARKEADLVLQGTTTGEYGYVFALPGDCLSLIVVKIGGTLIDYKLLGNKVLANDSADLRADYHYRPNEGDWSDDFAEGVIGKLRAHFYRALREDEVTAERIERSAEFMLTRAMVRDKRQSPPRKEARTDGGRLVSAWRGSVV